MVVLAVRRVWGQGTQASFALVLQILKKTIKWMIITSKVYRWGFQHTLDSLHWLLQTAVLWRNKELWVVSRASFRLDFTFLSFFVLWPIVDSINLLLYESAGIYERWIVSEMLMIIPIGNLILTLTWPPFQLMLSYEKNGQVSISPIYPLKQKYKLGLSWAKLS